ncbi:hypothetical protein EGW08_007911 [Elysia chlorotica]|uniref:Protein kinase domain-containing protein n=1 Tax=Elysia chlorotica TaxID=188477 RepID=A0A3S1C6I4_ELYCH|nr:hypothetical protein EGW08_007911 [Elysia chlorotica]
MEGMDFFLGDAFDSEDGACGYDPLHQLNVERQEKLKAEQDAIDRKDKSVTSAMGLEKVELLAIGRGRVLKCKRAVGGDSQAEFAVKITSTHQDHDTSEKFDKEVYLLKKLGDLNVARFVHAISFPTLGLTALVTEFCCGGSLRDALSSGTISGHFQLSRLAFTLIDTVSSIHRRDIVHRSICPDNILVTSAGMPLLSGFGSAVWLRPDEFLVRGVPGSPPYLAPEIAGRPFEYHDSYRADVFSLGMVLARVLFPDDFRPSATELLRALGAASFPYESILAVFNRDIQDYMYIHWTRIYRITQRLEVHLSSQPQCPVPVEMLWTAVLLRLLQQQHAGDGSVCIAEWVAHRTSYLGFSTQFSEWHFGKISRGTCVDKSDWTLQTLMDLGSDGVLLLEFCMENNWANMAANRDCFSLAILCREKRSNLEACQAPELHGM